MATKSLRSPKSDLSPVVPHFHGHRERLRAKFRETQGKGLADYELLELLLFLAIPRADTKPLAKALLQRFGSFSALLKAEEARILEVQGAGAAIVHVIQLAQVIMSTTLQEQVINKPIFASWNSVLTYCQASMAYNQRETFRLLFLDCKNQMIADEVQQTGTVDRVSLYPREVVKRALELGASALIMVHNHPSGDPTPSQEDVDMTLKVQEAGELLGVKLHDHIIIGKGRHSSLRSMGLV